ncbi:MAG: hypothetical protein RMJ56_08750 [Gemmataceae bacterium]|nr:hypothetical protein [Gemmataceae bacterium]
MLLIISGLLTASSASAAVIFADVTNINVPNQKATGTLGGIGFTLVPTLVRPAIGFGTNAIVGGVTNGTSTAFNNPTYFTPHLPSGDIIVLSAISDFRITFDSPITNPTLHIYQLSSNTLSFTSGGHPITFTLLSSDGDFTVLSGHQITGLSPFVQTATGDDANGSLLFPGTFTEISWTSNAAINGDGFGIQISTTTPEPASWALLLLTTGPAALYRYRRGKKVINQSP